MKYDFKEFSKDDFTYVYSPSNAETPEFTAEEDCIANRRSSENGCGYQYVSMLARETLHAGNEISTECLFESYGAPLIVISGDVRSDPASGVYRGRHFEIVAYENGINVWQLEPGKDRAVPTKLASFEFPLTAGEKHMLTVKVSENRFEVSLDERKMGVYCPDIPETFRAGITACEGINRFYSLEIK